MTHKNTDRAQNSEAIISQISSESPYSRNHNEQRRTEDFAMLNTSQSQCHCNSENGLKGKYY